MNLRRLVERLMPKRGLIDQLFGLESRSPDAAGVKTIVSVVFTTAPKTFDGPAVYVTAGSPQMTSRASSHAASTTADEPDETQTPSVAQSEAPSFTLASSFPTSTEDASSAFPTSKSSPNTDVTSSASLPSSTAPHSPLSTVGKPASITTTAAAATSSAASGGMSGGAKAGLAFGVIAGLAFVGIGAFLLFRRQKQKKQEGHERLDDEKAMMSSPDALPMHPQPERESTLPSPRNDGPAPRLSLRPVTEFQPNLAGDRASTVVPSASTPNLMPSAAAAAQHKNVSGTSTPKSGWERPGANRSADNLANPFDDSAANLSSSPPNDTRIVEPANVPLPATPTLPHPTQSVLAPPASLAPGPMTRDVDPADFPLPLSTPPSPKPPIATPGAPTQESSTAPAPSKASNVPAALVAGGGGAAAAVGMAAIAASKESPPESPAKPMSSPPANTVHRVQMDFAPSMDDELPIRAGELVRIQHEYDDGWALVQYMDGKRSGVVPRTCLSKLPLKPRPQNGPPQGPPQMRGRPMGPGMQPPRPLSPAGSGRSSRAPYAQAPRPLTPTGRNSPAPPYAQPRRPGSPYGQGRPASPMTRSRGNSNASPYVAYQPHARSMSPGPYGPGGQMKPPRPEMNRQRSNSMGNASPRVNSPPIGSSPLAALNQMPVRKPVSGASPPS